MGKIALLAGARPLRATFLVLLNALAFALAGDSHAGSTSDAKKNQVRGDPKAGARKADLCLLCHRAGEDKPLAPLLAGQPAGYLYEQLKAYKAQRRTDLTMATNAGALTERDMRDIAQYFAARPPERIAYKVDPRKVAAGRAKAAELDCVACHRQQGKERNVPGIAGQKPAYLLAQLEAFAAGKRPHGSGSLAAPALKLSREEAENLADYFGQAQSDTAR